MASPASKCIKKGVPAECEYYVTGAIKSTRLTTTLMTVFGNKRVTTGGICR
jgi:hypothetical protein